MGSTERETIRAELWEAALRDAAGVCAAYLTPEAFGLGVHSLAPDFGASDFAAQIRARIDLGRAAEFERLLADLRNATTTAYRHEILRFEGEVAGKLHVPRLVLLRARGDRTGVPVVRARRQLLTPENLLIAEALRISRTVCAAWEKERSAEGVLARRLMTSLTLFERSQPWADLRSQPRPALSQLVAIVRGRIVHGIVPKKGPMQKVVDLFGSPAGDIAAFDSAVRGIAFLATDDSRFEDKIFELLCLSWMITAARDICTDVRVEVRGVRSSKGVPVVNARFGGSKVEVFFQRASGLLPKGRWSDVLSGRPLGALPDFVLRVEEGSISRIVLLDAKNRGIGTESEVAYKLLGYKENLGLKPFVGIGLYPSYSDSRTRVLINGEDIIVLLHVPVQHGAAWLQRALQFGLQQISAAALA